jgi:TRAP-type C4-dicarboxylate transport system permease small subunit
VTEPAVVDRGSDRRPAGIVRLIDRLEAGLLALILLVMVVLAGAQIVLRNTTGGGIGWADPALRVLVLWLAMAGALAATRDNSHLTVDVVSRLLPGRARAGLRVVTDLVTSGVSGLVAYHAVRLVLEDRAGGLLAFGSVPVWVCELVLPTAFGLIALRFLAYAWQHVGEAWSGRVVDR